MMANGERPDAMNTGQWPSSGRQWTEHWKDKLFVIAPRRKLIMQTEARQTRNWSGKGEGIGEQCDEQIRHIPAVGNINSGRHYGPHMQAK